MNEPKTAQFAEQATELDAPPGMILVRSGKTRKGDYFYVQELRAWAPVPESGFGQEIETALVARETPRRGK